MRSGAGLHYILGNSKCYECLVPAEKLYQDMLTKAGSR